MFFESHEIKLSRRWCGISEKKKEIICQTNQRTKKLKEKLLNRDEDGQVTKVVYIIAPIECYRGYMYFNKENSTPMNHAVIENVLIL